MKEAHKAKSRRAPKTKFPMSSPMEMSQHLCLIISVEYHQPGKLTWASRSRVFIKASLHRPDWLIVSLPIGLNSVSKLVTWLVTWPTPTLNKDTPIRYDRYYLPEAKSKGQTSLWAKSNYFPQIFEKNFNFFFHCIHFLPFDGNPSDCIQMTDFYDQLIFKIVFSFQWEVGSHKYRNINEPLQRLATFLLQGRKRFSSFIH